jgi:hypothetical protein
MSGTTGWKVIGVWLNAGLGCPPGDENCEDVCENTGCEGITGARVGSVACGSEVWKRAAGY